MGCYPFGLPYSNVERREESKSKSSTKFRSIADVLMRAKIEKE